MSDFQPVGNVTVTGVCHNDDETTTVIGVDEAGNTVSITAPNGTLLQRVVSPTWMN